MVGSRTAGLGGETSSPIGSLRPTTRLLCVRRFNFNKLVAVETAHAPLWKGHKDSLRLGSFIAVGEKSELIQCADPEKSIGLGVPTATLFLSGIIFRVGVDDVPRAGAVKLNHCFRFAPPEMIGLRLHGHHSARTQGYRLCLIELVAEAHIEGSG